MIIYYFILQRLLNREFCGSSPYCIQCPRFGICDGKDLKCENPYVPIRYKCSEKDSLVYYAQELSMEAEKFMAKRAFWEGLYNITEHEYIEETSADNLEFSQFVEMLKVNRSRILTWHKDRQRWIVTADEAYWVGLILVIDDNLWLLFVVVLAWAGFIWYRKISKEKID